MVADASQARRALHGGAGLTGLAGGLTLHQLNPNSRNTMNRLATTALTLLLAAASVGASAADTQLTGCAAKRESIRSELRQAQEQGLSDKVAGLTRALDEVNAHCRDSSLVERHNKKILKAQAKVNQTERSLRLAQEANKEPKKIAKLEGKLEKARAELAALQAQQP